MGRRLEGLRSSEPEDEILYVAGLEVLEGLEGFAWPDEPRGRFPSLWEEVERPREVLLDFSVSAGWDAMPNENPSAT